MPGQRDQPGDTADPLSDLGFVTEETYLAEYEVRAGKRVLGRSHLAFLSGGQRFALPLQDLEELLKPRKTTPVPGTSDFLIGVMALRGVVVGVVDLAALLGLGPSELRPESRILILRGPDRLGCLVEQVLDVRSFAPDSIEPPPERLAERLQGFVTGVARDSGQWYVLLDSEKIRHFDALETHAATDEAT